MALTCGRRRVKVTNVFLHAAPGKMELLFTDLGSERSQFCGQMAS